MNFTSGFHEDRRRSAARRRLPDVTRELHAVKQMTFTQWDDFLAGLYERDERLEVRRADEAYLPEEAVDAYVLSAHAEAMQSAEVEGDLWGTLADIEETAATEEEAWQKIVSFYTGRGCLLVQVTDADEPEEWLLSGELAQRLKLL